MQGALRWGSKILASRDFWRHGLLIEAVRTLSSTASGTSIPDPEYLDWRVATAYGTSDATVPPADVIAYLRWRRLQRRMSR